jgi:hypothetical protein
MLPYIPRPPTVGRLRAEGYERKEASVCKAAYIDRERERKKERKRERRRERENVCMYA